MNNITLTVVEDLRLGDGFKIGESEVKVSGVSTNSFDQVVVRFDLPNTPQRHRGDMSLVVPRGFQVDQVTE